ncbi:histidine phosphatase family protein [Acetobacteraceae bacterium]|nr:histidine phosphatase family protein [Acetobacteraceae bacterium]
MSLEKQNTEPSTEKLVEKDFWFLRHGETNWNVVRRFQGLSDIPLNDHGREQAKAAAQLLVPLFQKTKQPFDILVSSPLWRAKETAEIVQKTIKAETGITLPLHVENLLIEVNFGIKEGTLPDPTDPWYKEWMHGAPPPKGAESFQTLQKRILKGMNKTFQNFSQKKIMFVAHGAVFRAVRGALSLPPEYSLPNATPVALFPPDISGQSWNFNLHTVTILA